MASLQQRVLMLALFSTSFSYSADLPSPQPKARFRSDDPILIEPEPRPLDKANSRSIDDVYDYVSHTFVTPRKIEREERAGKHRAAQDVNTLGDVPDGPWYTNRHWLRPMSIEELKRGPGNSNPPSEQGSWKVVAAKSDGITPGFTIEDQQGRRYLLKFDPPRYPELATAADVVGSKFFYALGYWTPENYIVHFPLSRLEIDPKATYKAAGGKRKALTLARVRELLKTQGHDGQRSYRAVASRLVEGTPIGPFRYQGARTDDPNDLVPHEDRRSLRGLAVFSAWLNHTDTRSINTLDTLIETSKGRFVRHNLIDFGATLGSDSVGPKESSRGHEFDIDPKKTVVQMVTFGALVPRWERVHSPKLRGVGRFESASFNPRAWKSAYPNPAFMRMDEDDAFWAAKQVAAFTDEDIRAIVSTGEYSDPAAAEYLAKTLMQRRDKIVSAYISDGLPLIQFRIEQEQLSFVDLSSKTARQPREFEVLWAPYENESGRVGPWSQRGRRLPSEVAGLAEGRHYVARIQPSNRTEEDQRTVDVYVRRTEGGLRVVGIDRRW